MHKLFPRHLVLMVFACLAFAATAAAQKRVLYITHVGSWYLNPAVPAHAHESRPHAGAVMAALGQSSGAFTLTTMDDTSSLSAAVLAQYDAVVYYGAGELPWTPAQKQAFLDFVASGKGFVAFHSATDSFYTWPEYGALIGAYFDTHWDIQTATIRVEDPSHVAMQGLAPAFAITDEIYQFRVGMPSRADTHVLMSLDTASIRPSNTPRPDNDYALAWTRRYGAGRVFYSALGHRTEVWDDPRFRAHVLGGIRWALGDGDGDGLNDEWEARWGLVSTDATGVNGAGGDPDGDGQTNLQEQAAGTHPRGFSQRYLAEGATSWFFETRIGVLNPNPTFTARVQMRYQLDNGTVATDEVTLSPRSRRTMVPPPESLFSTLIVSDAAIVADRTMTWSAAGHYGSHAESALTAPAPDWYFAEGSTHGGFDVFFLIQNPSDQTAEVDARFLRPAVGGPVSRHYSVTAHRRLTIQADEIPGLEAADLAAEFHSANGAPIIVERAMYLSRPGELWSGGTAGTGVTALGTSWFLAEGATGTFFDTFVLIANPNPTPAQLTVTFLLPAGQAPVVRSYTLAALGRLSIPVEQVDPALAGTSVSITIASTNGVPVVAERTMWWPGSDWYEGHSTLATNTTGTAWAVADAATGGADNTRTYLLVASGASPTSDSLRVSIVRDAGPPLVKELPNVLLPNSRFTFDLGVVFPEIVNERIGVILESMGQNANGAVTPMPIVVERAMYSDAGGVFWAAGSNLVATRLR